MLARRRQLTISRGDTQLGRHSSQLILIPGDSGDTVIGVSNLFSVPIYWRLPDMFLGDKVLSYNGYLRSVYEKLYEHLVSLIEDSKVFEDSKVSI